MLYETNTQLNASYVIVLIRHYCWHILSIMLQLLVK